MLFLYDSLGRLQQRVAATEFQPAEVPTQQEVPVGTAQPISQNETTPEEREARGPAPATSACWRSAIELPEAGVRRLPS